MRQRLRGHHVLDLAGADAERERAEGTVGGGVRIAANYGHAGLGRAKLGADHVHDALRGIFGVEELDVEVGAVFAQRLDLRIGDLVDDDETVLHGGCGNVVVDGRDVACGIAERAAGKAQALEGLRAGDLVDELEIDVEDRGLACGFGDDVIIPDFFEHGARREWLCCGGQCHSAPPLFVVSVVVLLLAEAAGVTPMVAGSSLCGVPSGSISSAFAMCCGEVWFHFASDAMSAAGK